MPVAFSCSIHGTIVLAFPAEAAPRVEVPQDSTEPGGVVIQGWDRLPKLMQCPFCVADAAKKHASHMEREKEKLRAVADKWRERTLAFHKAGKEFFDSHDHNVFDKCQDFENLLEASDQ